MLEFVTHFELCAWDKHSFAPFDTYDTKFECDDGNGRGVWCIFHQHLATNTKKYARARALARLSIARNRQSNRKQNDHLIFKRNDLCCLQKEPTKNNVSAFVNRTGG